MRMRKFRRGLRFREKAIAHIGVTRETFADNFQCNDGFEIAMTGLISSAKCSLAEQRAACHTRRVGLRNYQRAKLRQDRLENR